MTKDDIDKLWHQAMNEAVKNGEDFTRYRFATLVAAHKAEVALAEAYRCGYKDGMKAAAVICESLAMQQDRDVRDECAAAIRARGNT
jgi:hypothetical protein